MSDDTDFLRLYRLLGVEPGCTLQAFKQAYRRRVAELHPDRRAGDRDRSEVLKELNLQYAASLAFHRRHGRLPGTRSASTTRFGAAQPAGGRTPETRASPPPVASHRPTNRWLLLGLSLAAVIPLCSLLPSDNLDNGIAPASASNPADDASAPLPTALQLGMEAVIAATLLGESRADRSRDDHWVLGASWIHFDCGQVVDWYSSPARPLPVTVSRPAESDRHRHRATQQHRCTKKPTRESTANPTGQNAQRHSGTV